MFHCADVLFQVNGTSAQCCVAVKYTWMATRLLGSGIFNFCHAPRGDPGHSMVGRDDPPRAGCLFDFCVLGSHILYNHICKKDVEMHIRKAATVFRKMKKIWGKQL